MERLDSELSSYLEQTKDCRGAKNIAEVLQTECSEWIDRLKIEGIDAVLERGKYALPRGWYRCPRCKRMRDVGRPCQTCELRKRKKQKGGNT